MIHLNYKVYGQGNPLIILHGLFGSLDNWVSHARILSENYSVYLLDQRNHGKSPHQEEWDYSVMAEDLYEFLNQHGIFRANLLGHSMGGKTVMQFATRYPEMCEKLIIADMAPKAYSPHHDDILAAMNSLDLSELSSRKEAQEWLSQRLNDPAIIQFLLKSLGRDEEKQFRWKFNFEVLYKNYPNVLAAPEFEDIVDVPSLFLYGGDSNYLQEDDKEPILSHFPQASFHKLVGAGHWVHADKPKEFLSVVTEYLSK